MNLVQAREQLNAALADMKEAGRAIQKADAKTVDLNKLEANFDAAEREYNRARDEYRLAEAEHNTRYLDRVQVTRPDRTDVTYHRRGPNGFFRDIRDSGRGDFQASKRLDEHKNEMLRANPAGAKFDLNSTDATGGYLVPPLWLQEEFVTLARAGAPTVNAIGPRPLPPNTDSINLPRMSTGTAVATQSDNSSVQETDAAFDTIAADVKTVAGLQDVSQQVVDRSVPGVDEVIFADLTRAFYTKLDTDVLNSSTSNNKGLLQASGLNSITYTSGTPTVPALYSKLADGIRQIHEGVFMPPTAIFMHPRRWAWILAALDSQNRPLVTPYSPINAAGVQGPVAAQGLVGSLQGQPVYVDANIPTNLGAGTNEDRIIIARTEECFLYTAGDGPYLGTFTDVGSGTLTVRFRLHSYWAQINERRPKAISVISGTGLSAITF
jgi:HK97 family phage major capsid protein